MPLKLFKFILLYADRTVTKRAQLHAQYVKFHLCYIQQCTKATFILDEPVLCLQEMKKVIEEDDFASL